MQFRDLQKQYEVLKSDITEKIQKVCLSAHYISGQEVAELERTLAEYVGVKHCITCANGTDALTLAIKAWGLGKGDAVFVPDFTFFSSGECPANEECTCIFVDVDKNTYNMDAEKLEEAIQRVKKDGKYEAKAVVAVDLFGQPADYDAIKPICEKYGLLLLEDGAQGFGGKIDEKRACSFGDVATTSFFPAKPLGCYGDGGALFTNNDELAELMRSIRVHGKGSMKYDNVRIGLNSRLDTLQAAILSIKLKAFKTYEVEAVNEIAMEYSKLLSNIVRTPLIPEGFYSSWAQYTIKLSNKETRDALQNMLRSYNIPTMVYYPKPMHKQTAFRLNSDYSFDCSITEKLCDTVLSLPMHPYLKGDDIELVASKIKEYFDQERI